MGFLTWLFDAQLQIGTSQILWREIFGNAFGIASAFGGMRRKVWAWPVGIIANVTLFTVFMGVWFHTPQDTNLIGQAGRQIMFITVSLYGWWRWSSNRRGSSNAGESVIPKWAGRAGRIRLAITAIVAIPSFAWLFSGIGAYGPHSQPYATYGPWLDAWIFVGSALATYGMARGWTEFWLIWIAVDIVGVPFLIYSGYYPSAVLYAVYAGVVWYGFRVWIRAQRDAPPASAVDPDPDACPQSGRHPDGLSQEP